MSQFLETLKLRLADAHQRLQLAQVNLGRSQQEHAAVMAEFTSWQNAVNVETRKEQLTAAQAAATATSTKPNQSAPIAPQLPAPTSAPAPVSTTPDAHTNGSDVSKANLIREVLRQHPNGITPADVWKAVRDQVGRPYVYSVLKRLKDRKQVLLRRGKYSLVVAVEPKEGKDQSAIVQ
jgi:hypothetical protein